MTQDRRITDKLPTEKLVFTEEELIAAAQGHLRAESAAACLIEIPNTEPALLIGVGPKETLLRWLQETASQSQAVPSELASLPIHTSTDICGIEWMAEEKFVKLSDVQSLFSHSAATGKVPEGCAVDGRGTTYHNVAEIYYQAEALEALHLWLDDKGAPRADADDKVFSPVGRVAGFVRDAERLRWLIEDHDEAEVREKARELAVRLGTSSYFAITRDIDAAMGSASPAAPLAGKAEDERINRLEWGAVHNALEQAQAKLQEGGTRHSWLDAYVTLAAERSISAPLAAAVPAEEATQYVCKCGHSLNVCVATSCEHSDLAPAEPAPIMASALTDERIKEVALALSKDWASLREVSGLSIVAFARAIEREVLSRLSKPTAQGTAAGWQSEWDIADDETLIDLITAWSKAEKGDAKGKAYKAICRHIAAQAPAGRDAIRDEALEEAAKVADDHSYGPAGAYDYSYGDAESKADDRADEIAEAIRRLKSQTSGGANG